MNRQQLRKNKNYENGSKEHASLQNFPVEQQRSIGGSLDGIFNAYGSIQLHLKSF